MIGPSSVLGFISRPDLGCCYVVGVFQSCIGVDVQAFRHTPGDEFVEIHGYAQNVHPATLKVLHALVGSIKPLFICRRQQVSVDAKLQVTRVILASDPEDAGDLNSHGSTEERAA